MQFPGANMLANRLSPQGLDERKKALAQRLAQQRAGGIGGMSRLALGASQGDSRGGAPGLSFNPWMTGYLHAGSLGEPSSNSAFFNTTPPHDQGAMGGPPIDAGVQVDGGQASLTPTSRQLFAQRQPPPPAPVQGAPSGGISGGLNPYMGFNPAALIALMTSLNGMSTGNTFQAV